MMLALDKDAEMMTDDTYLGIEEKSIFFVA